MTVSAPPVPVITGRRINVLAVSSVVTAVLALNIVAIVLGHISLVQIKQSAERGKALAIVGLVLGYLGLFLMIAGLIILVLYTQSGPMVDTTFP